MTIINGKGMPGGADTILIASVAVDKVKYSFDILYSYIIPESLRGLATKGMRVLVPFGHTRAGSCGIIFDVSNSPFENKIKGIKEILAVLDKKPILDDKMLNLALWMKENYYCTVFEAVKTMLPSGMGIKTKINLELNMEALAQNSESLSFDELSFTKRLCKNWNKSGNPVFESRLWEEDSLAIKRLRELGIVCESSINSSGVGERSVKILSINDKCTLPYNKLTHKQSVVYDFIKNSGMVSFGEVIYFTGVSKALLGNMIKKEFIKVTEEREYRSPSGKVSASVDLTEIILTKEQEKVYTQILECYKKQEFCVSLLYGITGSGKTSVFIKLIDYITSQGKSAILMVPEISLTAQLSAAFKMRYGDGAAIFHSGLSQWERVDEWRRVRDSKARVIIGTRTAVFAPVNDLGIIIIDEEQEYTYKSGMCPRFHARDVAGRRCRQNKGLLLLASATPSIESYFSAESGIYSLHTIEKRYGNARLPKVEVVDMNNEIMEGNVTPFSRRLLSIIEDNTQNGRQSILLLNRRGFHTFVKCRGCGEVVVCPSCNISLNYHKDNNRLMCHYCGYSVEFIKECPKCRGMDLGYTGLGTQRAQEQLREILPGIRIVRVDADTTISKGSHERIFKSFSEGNYDVMIGTQMVSKGLNFPNVTLVGVLSADQALYSDDFRSYERAFDLMTQVVGRAGRGDNEGCAIIQTFTPENPIISMAAQQDYKSFYKSEIAIRKAMLYPPFSDICVIGFTSEHENTARNACLRVFEKFRCLASEKYKFLPLRIFRPMPASVNRVCGKYRYRIVAKSRNGKELKSMLSELVMYYERDLRLKDTNIFIDINPDIIP